MTISTLLSTRYQLVRNADYCVIFNEQSKVVETIVSPFNTHFKYDVYEKNVISFDFIKSQSYEFKSRYFKRLRESQAGIKFLETVKNLTFDASILFVTVSSSPFCFVVTEKYYNDGTHNTSCKYVNTSIDNISVDFVSDDEADTFVRPFPSEDDAHAYLTSRFYIDLVEKRRKNRTAKAQYK